MVDRKFYQKTKSSWLTICQKFPNPQNLHSIIQTSLQNYGLHIFRCNEKLEASDQSKSELVNYLGQLGTVLNQSPEGCEIFEVKDECYDTNHPKFRGPSSNHQLTFHTDRCDTIVFYCVRPAELGGINRFIRAKTLYNLLKIESPELLKILEEPFIYKRHNADPAFPNLTYFLPVFDKAGEELYITLMTYLISKADQDPDLPSLTEEQSAALSKVQEICQRKENQLEIKLEAGDLLFLDNTQMLHSRTAFEDKLFKRLYYRVWMTFPWCKDLPASFQPIFGETEAGKKRGGFRLLKY